MVRNINLKLACACLLLIVINIAVWINAGESRDFMLIINGVSSPKLIVVSCSFTILYFLSFAVALKYNSIRWEKCMFYGIMMYALCMTVLVGYMTHGVSVRTVLSDDPHDVLMDFFNSVQYGMKPYENKVIYPPLINVLYGLLKLSFNK